MNSKENYNCEKVINDITRKPQQRQEIFRDLSIKQKADVILGLSKHLQSEIILKLKKEEIGKILGHLDTDEATDILQLLPKRTRDAIVVNLNEELKKEISLLLKFDPQTAAGLMNVDYIQVKSQETVSSAVEQIKIHEKRTGKIPTVLVVENGDLIGYLSNHELFFGRANSKVEKYTKKIIKIKYNAKIEKIVDLFQKNPHRKAVVLGESDNTLGIIYSDDVLSALKEKSDASLYDFAGVSQEESVLDGFQRKVKNRYKWLTINLFTVLLASLVVGLFDDLISEFVLLAVYMPIVAGMGGNAGTQTLAVMVRGISLGQISLKTAWTTLRNEMGAGLVNGLINGLIITAIIYFKDGDLRIGLILALAMIINLLIAAFFGTLMPLFMKKIGKDPATSATIFITTATDVLGFLIFLSLATWILR
jgi:magnesium transporter